MKKLSKNIKIFWAGASLVVMLALAGWQYRQVVLEGEVEAYCHASCKDYATAAKRNACIENLINPRGCQQPQFDPFCGAKWNNNGDCRQNKAICELLMGGVMVKKTVWDNNPPRNNSPGRETEWACVPKNQVASPSPSPSPTPTPTPSPSPSPTPTPSPSPSPLPSPSPSPSPLPSPSPSPSPNPSPSPSPEPDRARFVIRKFKDDDQDGNWDDNEGATGLAWHFQFRQNSDDWQEYVTDANTGWGGEVTVGVDTKIEIREVEVGGWVNTTGLTKIEILGEEKLYYFDFGNFKSPEAVEVSPPPTAPVAGVNSSVKTWLGIGAVGVILQLLALAL